MGDEPNPPDILYHYCSNAAFLSIVETDSIWLSDLSLSNDSHEGQSPIRKVVLGPRNITPISVIKGFLAKHGHEDVEVVPSKASYR